VLDWCHLINTPEHGEEALRAHAELPIRSVFAYGPSMTRKLSELEMAPGETVARNEIEKLTSVPSGALMTFALALQGPESTSMELAKQEIGIARELGLPMTMHVGMHDGTPPRRSVARLADAGLLGSDMQFVHCCSTSDAELCQMTDAGAMIVICPISEMALAIGIPPTGRAREAGLEPALGSDAVCSSSGDLFDEGRVALLAERCLKAQAFLRTNSEISASEDLGSTTLQAIEAITVNGAKACWLGSLVGSLAVGKRADIIVLGEFDLSVPSLRDIQAAVVTCAHGANVDTVIVDGEIVKRDGTLVGIDRVALGAALAGSRDRLFSRAGNANR
jgi:cytosine/adenosine deaminase-related metal-dependent hydrolase